MVRLFIPLYLSLVVVLVLGASVLERFFYLTFQQEITQDLTRDYIGGFILMEKLYLHYSETQWRQLLEDINARSNLPVESRPIDDWQFDDGELAVLNRGEFLVADADNGVMFGSIAEGVVARIGPLGTTSSVENLELWYLLTMAGLLGLLLLFWVGWQQYKITRLARTTLSFSEGNLQVRAKTGLSGMPVLSRAFNQMAERIQRLFQSHRQLTNAVSHELRSPITKIRFQLELLDEAPEQPERDRLMVGISDDLDDMDVLIDEMLDYAKMERAEPALFIETRSLGGWIAEQVEGLKKEVRKPLTIAVADAGIEAQFDQVLMARLLRNLVSNAERYAEHAIQVGGERRAGRYRLWVDDDGPGIAPQERERLFEPFTRVDQSRDRRSGGHGLGLAIVAQIARWHRGTIEIDVSPLGGARVILSWPPLAAGNSSTGHSAVENPARDEAARHNSSPGKPERGAPVANGKDKC
ncbi:hypothetical protein FKG94_01560 [Exilibacterium tricleocarpae]|uniref:histidine kinase n=1 Tax=Exilibacterium tricleocarpae TaxID=2591008 RepID=A0A545U9V9_9GAMM|nr:ATP-binding protein [Exilibacterium tricleocarpae]TQV86264.1 hypothetical protein FKG94_01560 [Exilibacterium tricleocarpae]